MSENPEYLFWYSGFLYFGKEAVMTNQDYMKRALELAKKAMGYTSPNPMVGCVVVKDGRIVTEGYHERCGEYHAERNALTKCSEDLTGATMYVTLEPCCHQGKTGRIFTHPRNQKEEQQLQISRSHRQRRG